MDYSQVHSILRENAGKNFVQRILTPKSYPVLELGDNDYATHKMAWGQAGDKYVVFPTVQMDGEKLQDFGKKAFGRAMDNGEYIEFDDPKAAEDFSKSYKLYWEKNNLWPK